MVCGQCGGVVKGTRCMRCNGKLAAPRAHGKKRALLVGIQYTGSKRHTELKGTINDVWNMKSLLCEVYKFPHDSMRVLTDYDQRDPKMLPNILRGMQWLVQNCSAGDSLVFYFAGHGDHVKDDVLDGDEDDGWDEVLCALDKNIVDDETIVRPLVRGVTLHAIIDACRSGTVLDLPKIWDDGDVEEDPEWVNNRPRKGAKQKGTRGGYAIMISGSNDRQFSYEHTSQFGLRTGGLTTAFHAAVIAEPRTITYGRLKTVKANVLKLNKGKQTPQLSSSSEFDINQTHFSLSTDRAKHFVK